MKKDYADRTWLQDMVKEEPTKPSLKKRDVLDALLLGYIVFWISALIFYLA